MPTLLSFTLRRLAQAIAMYLALVLALSAVFNGIADRSLRAQVEDETLAVLRAAGTLDPNGSETLRNATTAELTRRYRLDESWPTRVVGRAFDVLTLRLGKATSLRSPRGDQAVIGILLEALPNTLLLFGTEALGVLALGLLVGLLAARRRGRGLDRLLSFLPPILNGLPSWWIAMLALSALAYSLPLFPAGGIHVNPAPGGLRGIVDLLWHLALPLAVLVALNLWGFALQARNLIGGLAESPWIAAARARGVPERSLLLRHTLAGASPALLSLLVLGLLQSLSGNLLIEGIFGWPGLGSLYFVAVQQSDVPVLLGLLAFQILLNLAGLVGLDIAYRIVDPRVAFRDSVAGVARE